MKKFRFTLEKVLNLREFEEKQAKEELGRVISISNKLNAELQQIAIDRVNTRNSSTSLLSISEFTAAEHYVTRLDNKKEQILVELAQNELLIEQKRKLFAQAMQNRKVITKLKEKQFKEWRMKNLHEEEATTDDIANSRFGVEHNLLS